MSETAAHQNTFNEKSKLLNIALKYTNGDMERAKFMVSGQYNDVKIIKGKFNIEEHRISGMLIIFINLPNRYIMHMDSLMLPNDNIISKASIFDSWKAFYADLVYFIKQEENIAIPAFDFNRYLVESLGNDDIYPELEGENLESLTRILNDIIGNFHSTARVNCQLNIDNSSSLTLELSDIPIEELKIKADKEESEILSDEYSKKIADIESKASYVLNGRIIISPIKGKHISDIKVGEKIKVVLTGKNDINKHVAKSLNALSEENEILPINMRVTEKFPMEKKGYYIYGLIAKNILVKVIEEEDVKIETDIIQKITKSAKNGRNDADSRTILYIVLLIGLLFIILFLIFFLL